MTDPRNVKQLKVFHQKNLAGILTRISQGAKFDYDADYLANAVLNGVAFHLPKRKDPYEITGSHLHPFFAGLLPEGLWLKAMVKGLKTSIDDLFTLFAAQGGLCVGDVWPENIVVPRAHEIPKLSKVSFQEYFEELLEKPLKKIGSHEIFAGVQNKISASTISFPVNIAKQNKAYVLKLNSRDYPRIVENEYVCLKFAKKCGLPVVNAKTVKDSTKQLGLLVERFDRRWNLKGQNFDLIHQEDACQFMNLYPSDKYRVSVNEVVQHLQRWSTAPTLDVLELIIQYMFSYLICNGDMHAKNISLLREHVSGRVSLAPAYDLVSTLPYGDQKMALKIDGRDDKMKAALFLNFGERFGVPQTALKNRLQKFLKKFELHLPRFLQEMSWALDDPRKHVHFEKTIKSRLKDVQVG